MLFPETNGQRLFFCCMIKNVFPALSNGFSSLPPPATTPIVARQLGKNVFSFFDGRRTTTPSGVFVSIFAHVPPARTNLPPSPGCSSILQIIVPSGISCKIIVLPSVCVCAPTASPIRRPSTATTRHSSPSS